MRSPLRRRRIFVLWSGGLDSTYLLQRCLADERYELVEAGYVQIRNNPRKAEAEAEAIARLLPRFQDHPRLAFRGLVLDLELPRTNPNLAYKQMPLWLLAVVAGLHMPVDEVAIGYVRDDNAAAHLDDLRRIYESYRPLMHRAMPRLTFPLARLRKATVYERLDPALRALCITCEAPETGGGGLVACGRCRTCQRRLRDLPAG